MKTSELIGPALDWAVATIVAKEEGWTKWWVLDDLAKGILHGQRYHDKWEWGGPIIEREGFTLTHQIIDGNVRWDAQTDDDLFAYGPTPLIAAMRCYVASRLGDEVEIPEELK